MGTSAQRPADGTGGLTWRALTTDDIPAWFAMVQAMEAVDQPVERYAEQDLMDELVQGSWKDPANDTLVGVDEEGTPRAVGLVVTRPGDLRSIRAYCDGGVHPDWRRHGIGATVVRWQHARALEKVAAARAARAARVAGDQLPGRVMIHAEERLEDRARLFDRMGFAPVRWYVDMLRPLAVAGGDPVPESPVPEGLRLAPFGAELDEKVRLAHNEAFADHWGSEPRTAEDWQLTTAGSRELRRDWSFVVLDGDEVAGYVVSAAYEQEWEPLGHTQGWTDILGVRRAWRRRGVAASLLAATMTAFACSGMEYAGLGVDSANPTGALGVYERMGYRPDRRSVTYAIDV